MSLLAIQYGLQPHLQQRCVDKRVNKIGLVLACEAVKLVMSAVVLMLSSLFGGKTKPASGSGSLLLTSILCSIPALIYVVQNVCVQIAYADLDSITFNCLNQLKLISTAIALYVMRGVTQNKKQMLALTLISMGGVVLASSSAQPASTSTSLASMGNGLTAIFIASGLSGVAATLTQVLMQGDRKVTPYFLTMCMSVVSILVICGPVVVRNRVDGKPMRDAVTELSALFDHWTPLSIVPVCAGAVGGILVGLVTNYCGSLDKGVSFISGLALSAICQCAYESRLLPLSAAIALVFVARGSWMHTVESVKAAKLKTTEKKPKKA